MKETVPPEKEQSRVVDPGVGEMLPPGEDLQTLQKKLGYEFHDRRVLLQALTHKSYGHEFFQDRPISQRDNERMEFLGDSILNGVVTDILLETFPEAPEGKLSKMRAAVVNERTLAKVAEPLNLPRCLRLGKGEAMTQGRTKPSIVSSALEAVIAAIYLDGGFLAVHPVVRHLFAPLFQGQLGEVLHFKDHKTALQEALQAKFKATPSYVLLGTKGPEHSKVFEVAVSINGTPLARGEGRSKKEAEQNAAQNALSQL
jgi:ribonuclease-3